MHDLAKQAGIDLPQVLGSIAANEPPAPARKAETPAPAQRPATDGK